MYREEKSLALMYNIALTLSLISGMFMQDGNMLFSRYIVWWKFRSTLSHSQNTYIHIYVYICVCVRLDACVWNTIMLN